MAEKKINVFEQPQVAAQSVRQTERIDSKTLPPGIIKNRNMESGLFAVKVSETRPTTGNEYRFHFLPSTGVFSAWNGSAWITTTLT